MYPLNRYLQCFRADLAKRGITALPYINGPGIEDHAPVLKQPNNRSRRQNSADMRRGRYA